jgi:hypothetical protein
MPARRHAGDPLPAFLSGEDRSSVALLRAGGVLRLPSDDDPAGIKRLQRADELLCPVETCGAPEMDAALGPVRRHHFRHRAGTRGRTGHSRETAFHEAAKHLLRLWAEQQGATAVVEGEVRTRGRTTRRADALAVLTTSNGPRRVAFEVQYATLRLEGRDGWPERTADYAAAGVPDVWLFGHTGSQMTVARRSPGDDPGRIEVLLNAEQQHLARHGHPLRWINPTELIVATAVVDGVSIDTAQEGWWDRPEDHGPRRPRQGDHRAVLRLDALADCLLTPLGMVTPTDTWLVQERAAVQAAADQARAAAEVAAAEAAAAAAQREAERAAAALVAEQDAERRRQEDRDAELAEQEEAARERDRSRAAQPPSVERDARDQQASATSAPASSAAPTEPPRRPYVSPPHAPPQPIQIWSGEPAPDWSDHSLKTALERACGLVPAVIDQRLPTDDGVQADHRVWHATVYARLVHSNAGRSFNRGQVVEALFQDAYPHRSAYEMRTAGVGFLDALVAAGWLVELPGAYYGILRDATTTTTTLSGGWPRVTARDGLARID